MVFLEAILNFLVFSLNSNIQIFDSLSITPHVAKKIKKKITINEYLFAVPSTKWFFKNTFYGVF